MEEKIKLSNEYIRGLVEGEGCFTFHTIPTRTKDGKKKLKVPAFMIELHERDAPLLEMVRDHLRVKNKLFRFKPEPLVVKRFDGERVYKRGGRARLYVRDLGTLKNIIIPFFYGRLSGHKGIQFLEWLEKMNDEDIADGYKLLYRLHKCGFYEKNPKFLE